MILKPKRFIVRVYGIATNNKGEILLSDEWRFGRYMTKFVGGGLEFGEGLTDCLHREFMEECGKEISIGELLYINEHFQKSAFHEDGQLLSIYYGVRFRVPFVNLVAQPPRPWNEGDQYFRWVLPEAIEVNDLTWPVDREILRRIKAGMFRD